MAPDGAGSSERPALPVRRFVCAAIGAGVLTTVALGHWLALETDTLPRTLFPWPLIALSTLGLFFCTAALRKKPLDASFLLAAPLALVVAALWFSSLL